MKIVSLFAAIFTIAKFAYADDDAYCPQKTGECNASEKPSKEIKGSLVEQFKDEIDCSGDVVIDNACTFTVKDFVFKIANRTNHDVYWWGSRTFNTGKGAGNKLSSDKVEEVESAKDTQFTISPNSGCWANLNTDIGTFYLMDSDNKVLCHANVRNDLTDTSNGSSGSNGNGDNTGSGSNNNGSNTGTGANGNNSTAGGNANGSSTTAPSATGTGKPATATTTKKPNETDGTLSRYFISSGALYLIILAITLYLNN